MAPDEEEQGSLLGCCHVFSIRMTTCIGHIAQHRPHVARHSPPYEHAYLGVDTPDDHALCMRARNKDSFALVSSANNRHKDKTA